MRKIEALFPTLVYYAPLARRGVTTLNRELLRESYRIRELDRTGRRWSSKGYPGGYTSYGSLDRLYGLSSTFDGLRRQVDRHVRGFARRLAWDLRGRKLSMTDCWVNIMPKGCAHSFHLHPQAIVSGTYYVKTPRGCSGLKFEDPRLSRFMATPPRRPDPPRQLQLHVTYPARAGAVVLFESWLRHEVPPSPVEADRVSVSFNYHWT